jgi:hypothetical protein
VYSGSGAGRKDRSVSDALARNTALGERPRPQGKTFGPETTGGGKGSRRQAENDDERSHSSLGLFPRALRQAAEVYPWPSLPSAAIDVDTRYIGLPHCRA